MRRIALTVALLFAATNVAFAWGPSGHSIIAEITQSRLTPLTLQRVADLPGSGASLASIASWADDERAVRQDHHQMALRRYPSNSSRL